MINKKSLGAPLLGCSVLIADRNPAAQKPLKDELNSLGVRNIDSASDLSETVKMLSRGYDIIFLDTHLSDKRSASSLLEELSMFNLPKKTTRYLISSDRTANFLQPLIEYDFDCYIVKPFSPENLSKKIVKTHVKKRALGSIGDLLDQGKIQDASEACDRLSEEYGYCRLEIAKTLIEGLVARSHYEDATAQLDKKEFLHKNNGWASLARALCLRAGGNLDDALVHMKIACQDSPDFTRAHDILARELFERGELEEARGVLDSLGQLLTANSERMRFYSMLVEENDRQAAKQMLQKVLERCAQGKSSSTFDNQILSGIYVEEGRFEDALQSLQSAKGAVDALEYDIFEPLIRVRASLKKGDETKARESLFALLRKIEPRIQAVSSGTLHELAKICLNLEKIEDAERCLASISEDELGYSHAAMVKEIKMNLSSAALEKAASEGSKSAEIRESAPIDLGSNRLNGELAKKLQNVMSQ